MKRTAFILIFTLGALAGCSQPEAMQRVKDRFANAEVTNVPGSEYAWLIRLPDGSVRYCFQTSGKGDGVDNCEVFPPMKNK